MPSRTVRKGTGGLPRVPGRFSFPSSCLTLYHKSSGICHIVLRVVLDVMTLFLQNQVYGIHRPPSIFGIGTKTNNRYVWPPDAGIERLPAYFESKRLSN